MQDWRKTAQFIMPAKKEEVKEGEYDIYPTIRLEEGKIGIGYESLAKSLSGEKVLIIDGYLGVFFDDFSKKLNAEFARLGKKVAWFSVD